MTMFKVQNSLQSEIWKFHQNFTSADIPSRVKSLKWSLVCIQNELLNETLISPCKLLMIGLKPILKAKLWNKTEKLLFKWTRRWWVMAIQWFFFSTSAHLYSKCTLVYLSKFQEPNLWCVIRFRVFRLKWPSILYSFIQSRHICQVVGCWNVVHSHCCLFTVWRRHATSGRQTRPTQVQLVDRVQWQETVAVR